KAESHGQRHRNGKSHKQGRAPFPEPNQRNQHNQSDRLVERVHEEVNVLFHLARLIGSANNHQVVREELFDRAKFFVDVFAKKSDLLTRAKEKSDSNGAMAGPHTVFIAGRIEIKEAQRRLVGAANVHQIAQVDRTAVRRGTNNDIADCFGGSERAGRVDDDVFRAGFDASTWHGDVTSWQQGLRFRRLQAISGEPLLRVVEIDLLGNDARTLVLGGLRCPNQGSSKKVGEIVQFAIAVLVTCGSRQLLFGFLHIAHKYGAPGIRMKFRCLQVRLYEGCNIPADLCIALRRSSIDADAT